MKLLIFLKCLKIFFLIRSIFGKKNIQKSKTYTNKTSYFSYREHVNSGKSHFDISRTNSTKLIRPRSIDPFCMRFIEHIKRLVYGWNFELWKGQTNFKRVINPTWNVFQRGYLTQLWTHLQTVVTQLVNHF